jgi:hypothetical protein
MIRVKNEFKGRGFHNETEAFEVEFENEEFEEVVKEWLEGGELLTLDNEHIDPASMEHLENRLLVIRPDQMAEDYKNSKYQLLIGTGGFGVDPSKMGRAVFSLNLGDGEQVRWNREQIMGIVKKAGLVRVTKILEEER